MITFREKLQIRAQELNNNVNMYSKQTPHNSTYRETLPNADNREVKLEPARPRYSGRSSGFDTKTSQKVFGAFATHFMEARLGYITWPISN